MARRAATFLQSDLDRAAKAAAKVGYAVEIRPGGTVALVPCSDKGKNSGANDAAEVNPWDVVYQ